MMPENRVIFAASILRSSQIRFSRRRTALIFDEELLDGSAGETRRNQLLIDNSHERLQAEVGCVASTLDQIERVLQGREIVRLALL